LFVIIAPNDISDSILMINSQMTDSTQHQFHMLCPGCGYEAVFNFQPKFCSECGEKLTEDNKGNNGQPLSTSSTATNTHGQTLSSDNQPSNFRDKTMSTAGSEQSLITNNSCTPVGSKKSQGTAVATGKQNSHVLVSCMHSYMQCNNKVVIFKSLIPTFGQLQWVNVIKERLPKVGIKILKISYVRILFLVSLLFVAMINPYSVF